MAVSLKHTTQAVGTDAGNGEIGKTQWNEEHTLTMATGKLLGRSTAGTGAAEEITVGTGLSLSGGSLSATGSQNTFTTIAVAGQSDVVADSTTDTLTLAAGSNITITTNATTDTITIAASGGGGTPGGSDTQIQFNDGGSAFGGDSDLTWNKTTNTLTVTSGSITMTGNISSAAWTTSGLRYKNVSATLTDTTSTGTVATAYTNVYGGNTIAASNTTTFTDYFTTFINPPTAGTNVTFTRNWALGLGGSLQIESASRLGWSTDLILTRRGAANLRLGAADAAAPVAQTLSVQSVVAGTSNTAGANLTITGSQGTGTGAGGSIIFQVAPAGSSGTAQNALATALTIDSNKDLTLNYGQGNGIYFPSAGSIRLVTSSSLGIYRSDGVLAFDNTFGCSLGANQGLNFRKSNGQYSVGFSTEGTTDSVSLIASAGTAPTELRVYASSTSTTNYQRMSIKTLRESSGALSGASYTTTIAIPAYANLIGVTTRVTTAITGATSYSVGDGTTANLWGNNIAITLGSQSQTSDFTAVGAVGAAATSRTVKLTANGSNFTGGVVEICLHYITTEAD